MYLLFCISGWSSMLLIATRIIPWYLSITCLNSFDYFCLLGLTSNLVSIACFVFMSKGELVLPMDVACLTLLYGPLHYLPEDNIPPTYWTIWPNLSLWISLLIPFWLWYHQFTRGITIRRMTCTFDWTDTNILNPLHIIIQSHFFLSQL